MKKLKIFYTNRSTILNAGLDYLQKRVNTWIDESGAEIIDVKMNINDHDNPVMTVIYEENVPAATSEKSQQTPTHEDTCGGWQAGYNLGYHHGRMAYHTGTTYCESLEIPAGYCQIWEADWRRGYADGYNDGFQSMQKKIREEQNGSQQQN